MREIAYRVWDKKNRNMIYAVNHFLYFNGVIQAIGNTNWSAPREKYELLGYTGRNDKNGKKIFEDDFVKWDGSIYKIILSETDGAWILKDDREDWECPNLYAISSPKQSRIEIVGNVWENPELQAESYK